MRRSGNSEARLRIVSASSSPMPPLRNTMFCDCQAIGAGAAATIGDTTSAAPASAMERAFDPFMSSLLSRMKRLWPPGTRGQLSVRRHGAADVRQMPLETPLDSAVSHSLLHLFDHKINALR